MPRCALCDSTQASGESCDVCGRPFPAAEAVPVPVEPLPGLEATLYEPAADVSWERLADLEPTAVPAAGVPEVGTVEGFSPTAEGPVEVDVAPLEVERVGEDAPLDPPEAPAAPACRYCRTPSAPGQRLCAVCGMRLPLVRSPVGEAGAEVAPCRDCGIPFAGARCPACGARR